MLQQLWNRHQAWLKLVPWVALAVLFAAGLLGDQGVFRLYQLELEQRKLEAAIREQQDINLKLRREVHYLRTDSAFLEKLVREQMGYVKPGELVYQFQD